MFIVRCLTVLAAINAMGSLWAMRVIRDDLDWEAKLHLVGIWPVLMLDRLFFR